ncbi:MAG: hypothetical protein ACM3ZQ_12100 [Bacillota bacterium]
MTSPQPAARSPQQSTIRIHFQIRGHSVTFFPGAQERFDHELAEPATIRSILADQLHVNPHLIMGVIVNGKLSSKDLVPSDGDTVTLLSPPSGG